MTKTERAVILYAPQHTCMGNNAIYCYIMHNFKQLEIKACVLFWKSTEITFFAKLPLSGPLKGHRLLPHK